MINLQIVAINASPRSSGNTAQLLQMFIDEIKRQVPDAVSSLVQLNSLAFRGCQGCRGCKQEAATGCTERDELTAVLDQLAAADIWLIGTPIYMGQMSGQCKLFLDRFYGFTGPNWTSRLPAGKRAVVCSTQGAIDKAQHTGAVDLMARLLSRRGFAAVESLITSGVLQPDSPELQAEVKAVVASMLA